jgi:hypothetical protein
MLDRLANHEWHSSVSAKTNAEGLVELNGFRGEYRVSFDDRTASLTLSEEEPSNVLTVVVDR